ncbi:MAG: M56 family metallopeptidase [Eubacterium sp.]|nr:M56 family metallopeptidase [Eubacterium sp.]
MSELLKTLLSLSLSGTLLILLLFLCRPLYQNRLSKRWQYYIWLLVIARLLLPFSPRTSLIGNLFRQAEQKINESSIAPTDTSTTTENPLHWPGTLNPRMADTKIADTNNADTDTPNTSAADTDAANIDSTDARIPVTPTAPTSGTTEISLPTETSTNLPQILCVLWLFVALLLLVRKITVYQSFVKYIDAGSKPVDDIAMLERFGQIMNDNHIKANVDLRINSLVSSPLLIGFTHARIVLPSASLPQDDFYYTILHELTHYQRRDMFYKWLVQLTICLHWFNPFVRLMEHEIHRFCELSCDERIMKMLPDKARKSYGDTLLNAIGAGGSYKDTLASVTLNESKKLLKGRLDAIMKYHKIPKTVQTFTIFLTCILIGGSAVLGAYAAPGAKGSSDSQHSANASDYAIGNDSDYTIRNATDYTVEYEDGIYYIYTDGATEADKPISGVTSPYKKLVLVRKDGYTTFGSWDDYDMASLVKHITEQCRTMLANCHITQKDMDTVIAAATEIQEDYSQNDRSVSLHYYIQTAYYQFPYIIELGYNLPVASQNEYQSTSITLSDQSTMPVFFSTKSSQYMTDEAALSAITALIDRLAPKAANSSILSLEAPYIASMEYVDRNNMDSAAEKYYDEENLSYFDAVFSELDSQTQQEYLDRMFADEKIAFFACCLDELEDTSMPDIYKDIVNRYTLKAYNTDKIAFFAVLSERLNGKSLEMWHEKCEKEGNTAYQNILSEDN